MHTTHQLVHHQDLHNARSLHFRNPWFSSFEMNRVGFRVQCLGLGVWGLGPNRQKPHSYK
jgi:hypothetical protein